MTTGCGTQQAGVHANCCQTWFEYALFYSSFGGLFAHERKGSSCWSKSVTVRCVDAKDLPPLQCQ